MNTKQRLGWGTGVGGVLALALGGLAACSSDFSSDCRETRTCVADESKGGTGAGGDGDGDGDGSSQGGAGTSSVSAGAGGDTLGGGAGGQEPEGGAAGAPVDCQIADNCPIVNPPPTVVAITPADATADVEPDTEIVIELSEPLDAATVTAENVRIMAGEREVEGELTYEGSKITFVPKAPLGLLAPYRVVLSTSLTDVEGAGLAEEFASSFAVRDGVWSLPVTVEAGAMGGFAPNLQMDSDGQALLAWTLSNGSPICPVNTRWFRRGASVGNVKTLKYAGDQYCADVNAAVSPSGLALVSWFEEAAAAGQSLATAEFRNGKWGSATPRSERYDSVNGAIAVSDEGTMHYIGAGSDVQVWSTTAAGVWSAKGKALSPFSPLDRPQIAVAKNGDALAAWLDTDANQRRRIVVSSYSAQSSAWSVGTVLPGSLGLGGETKHGQPAVAFDAETRPLVVWQRGVELVASRFDTNQGVWGGYTNIVSGLDVVPPEPPALVFDGHTFVVAYASTTGKATTINLTRYDADADGWSEPTPLQSTATKASPRMPRLNADARGNLLALWASPVSTGVSTFAYRRFDAAAGAWLDAKLIGGVTIKNADFSAVYGRFALGGNANGLAAVSFSDYADTPKNLRLASFY